MTYPTPYPDINRLIDALLPRLQTALGEAFVGLYFYGSLASGDYVPGRSDVDLLVLTAGELSADKVAALRTLLTHMAAAGLRPNAHIEAVFLPLAELPRHDPDGPAMPTLNAEGEFYVAPVGVDWVFQRHWLRRHGWPIRGPEIRELIDPVSAEDMRRATRQLLAGWWAGQLEDQAWIEDAAYRAYAVLTMCRALLTLRTGEMAAKDAAAAWAEGDLGVEWRPMIRAAVAWREGMEFAYRDEVLDFIRYTLDQAAV